MLRKQRIQVGGNEIIICYDTYTLLYNLHPREICLFIFILRDEIFFKCMNLTHLVNVVARFVVLMISLVLT